MSAKRLVVVVNPHAAGGKAGRRWPSLREKLQRCFGPTIRLEERITDAPGAATALTRQALRDGADIVMALGGDGSANDVANGFFEPIAGSDDNSGPGVLQPREDGPSPGAPRLIREDAVFALLPFGTGGDLRRTLRIPRDPLRASEVLADLLRRDVPAPHLDVGRVIAAAEPGTGQNVIRHFINVASFGMSGVVDQFVSKSSKLLSGRITFMIATLQAFFHWRNKRIELRIDDAEPEEHVVSSVALGNGQFFGGGMRVAPTANPLDGTLNITILGDFGFWDFALAGNHMYDGTIDEVSGVSIRQAQHRVTARPAPGVCGEVPVEVDGELAGRLPAEFEIFPAVLPVLTPLGAA